MVSRYTTHSVIRFVQRYVERMPSRPALLQRELDRFCAVSRSPVFRWDGGRYRVLGSVLGANFADAQLISREEAEALLSSRLTPRPNRFYRSAGPEHGVWVVHWDGRSAERVLTFLFPGDAAEDCDLPV